MNDTRRDHDWHTIITPRLVKGTSAPNLPYVRSEAALNLPPSADLWLMPRIWLMDLGMIQGKKSPHQLKMDFYDKITEICISPID